MIAITDSAGAKVKVVLHGWEAAWNASDITAMWRLATDDVHWVNVVGMHWRGKAEVQKAHQVCFDLMFKDRSCKLDEIESIESLRRRRFRCGGPMVNGRLSTAERDDETAWQGLHVVGASPPR